MNEEQYARQQWKYWDNEMRRLSEKREGINRKKHTLVNNSNIIANAQNYIDNAKGNINNSYDNWETMFVGSSDSALNFNKVDLMEVQKSLEGKVEKLKKYVESDIKKMDDEIAIIDEKYRTAKNNRDSYYSWVR